LLLLAAVLTAPRGATAHPFVLDASDWTTPPLTVAVAGTFNDWSTTATQLTADGRVFHADLPLADGSYSYKFFVTDPAGFTFWESDKTNPCYTPNGLGGWNNLLTIADGQRVEPPGVQTFAIGLPAAEYATLTGDFSGWTIGELVMRKDPEGIFRCSVDVPLPITYKFVVDGIWWLDRSAGVEQVPDGFGAMNSFRPAPASHATLAAAGTTDQPTRMDLESRLRLPGDAREALSRSHQLARAGDLEGALQAARSLAARRDLPRDLRAQGRVNEGALLRRSGDTAAAARVFEETLAEFGVDGPGREAAYEVAKHRLHELGDPAGARQVYAAMMQSPASPVQQASLHADIGDTHRVAGEWAPALAEYEQGLALLGAPTPEDELHVRELRTRLLGSAGVCHYHLGALGEAEAAFLAAREADPWPRGENVYQSNRWLAIIAEKQAGGL
jgi:hypothetical protein